MAKQEGYLPRFSPSATDPEVLALSKHIDHELGTLARAISEQTILRLVTLHVEPTKPRSGMIAQADGTDWNPGSGEGPYAYFGGTWHKLFP